LIIFAGYDKMTESTGKKGFGRSFGAKEDNLK